MRLLFKGLLVTLLAVTSLPFPDHSSRSIRRLMQLLIRRLL